MDHLVAISEYVKKKIVKKYNLSPNNISVINRGIDTEYFNQPLDAGTRDNIIKTHQIDTAKKIILFPARMTNWKGQLEFFHIIKTMDLQNILILFAGDTKNESYTKLVRDAIKQNNLTANNISVINRGIDTKYFNQPVNSKLRDQVVSTYQIDTAKKIILFPARMTSWKGQLEFIDVIKKMDTQNLLVLFAGDTKNESYTKLVRDKIDKNNLTSICKILGSLNQNEIRSLYKIADLSVSFPLRAEGFGRIISESLYSNTPVLAFDYGGVKNQLENLSDLFKVKPHDYQALPSKIEAIFSLNDKHQKEVLQEAKSVIDKNFSKTNMLNKYLKLYESV